MTVVRLGKYMQAVLINELPKTQVWLVKSKNDLSTLGCIKWSGPWRQYCFFVVDVHIFSQGCFKDLASFLEELNRKHKQGK